MVLNRESILEAAKLKTEVVELEEGSVIVSEISALDYNEICELSKKPDCDEVDMKKFTPTLLAFGIVNENGERVFSNEDIPLLAKLAQKPFMKIADGVKRLNGLIGDEAKNSEAIPGDLNNGESL